MLEQGFRNMMGSVMNMHETMGISSIVEKMGDPIAEKERSQFIADMTECVDDFMQKITDFEIDDDIYEIDEDALSLDASDYGSGDFEYPTKAKAKSACMKAVSIAMENALAAWDKETEKLVASTKKCLENMETRTLRFVEEFYDSYDEFMELDCTERTRGRITQQRDERFGSQEDNQTELREEFSKKFDQLSSALLGLEHKGLRDVREYYELCSYEEEDESYAFELDGALDAIQDDINSFLANTEDFPASMKEAYRKIITEFCAKCKKKLQAIKL